MCGLRHVSDTYWNKEFVHHVGKQRLLLCWDARSKKKSVKILQLLNFETTFSLVERLS